MTEKSTFLQRQMDAVFEVTPESPITATEKQAVSLMGGGVHG